MSVILIILLSQVVALAQLPTSFQKVELLTGLKNSVNIEFAPDGRIFIVDRYGELLIYKPNTQLTVLAATMAVFHDMEDGLLSIAFDPEFTSNNFIYIHYSHPSLAKNRVSRFKMEGDYLNISSEIVLLEWTSDRNGYYHAAGDLDFDSKGNLYVAIGDNTDHSAYATLNELDPNKSSEKTSSNTNDFRGKILRIKPEANGTYSIPAGNLFPNGTGGRPEIYVMGARNPFKIFVDKANTDWLFWAEVGPDANVESKLGPEGMDEINLVKSAGNYGWPYFSGKNKPYLNTYTEPNFYYDINAPVNLSKWNTGAVGLPPAQSSWMEFFHGCYLVGPIYNYNQSINNPKKLPSDFNQSLFYYDFNTSKIWVVKMDINGTIVSNQQFGANIISGSGFIDLKIGPDGQLYILEYGAGCCPQNVGSGKLVRVDFTGIDSNKAPEVTLTADVTSGALPLIVNFSSEGTVDPEGGPLTYQWDFQSNGSVDSEAKNPSFTYTERGTFDALLRVIDSQGTISSKSIKIYAGNHPATFQFVKPADGGMMSWEDHIDYNVIVSDNEDGSTANGTISCSKLNFVPSFGHLNHSHDGITINNCQGTFYLNPTGHNAQGEDNIYYIFKVNYTDNDGLTSFNQVKVYPKVAEAEFYDEQSNTSLIDNTDQLGGGMHSLRALFHNAYIKLSGRNLLNITSLSFRVAAALGGRIEIRTGSPSGPLISTATVPSSGSVNNWVNVEVPISDPGGKHDLYFVFKRNPGDVNLFDLNNIEFIGTGVSVDQTPPNIYSIKGISHNLLSIKFNESLDKTTSEQKGNYSINNSVDILSATLQADRKTVILNTSSIQQEVSYELTVRNIKNETGIALNQDIIKSFVLDKVLFRTNSGGPSLQFGSELWKADQYFTGGTVYTTTNPISNTTNDALYQTERFGAMTYSIPVPQAGKYTVDLHFAELYFATAGSRVFNVNIENGQFALQNIDLFKDYGGKDAASVIKVENIQVNDGFLTISFTSVIDNAKISGIAVFLQPLTLTEAIRINAGGPNVQFGNELWEVDQYSSGGTVYATTNAISNTSNDALYQTERYGAMTYNIPVPQADKYMVDLHFAELYFSTAGSRVFNVDIENGQYALQNIDLFKDYGGKDAASVIKAENIQVNDGFLTINFSNVVNNAKISGISVAPQSILINRPPVITKPADITLASGQSWSYQVLASDPDAGAVLTYSATNLPASLAINAGTGLITGTISAVAGTVSTVSLSVKDQQSLAVSTSFVITISALANRPPVITQPADRSVIRKQAFSYQVIANDPEDNKTGLVYSAANLPGGLSINSTTGLISGQVNGSARIYNVILGVKDKEGFAAAGVGFKLTVLNGSQAILSSSSLLLSDRKIVLVEDFDLTKISVFPNPAKNNFSIQFGVTAKSQWKFVLYNTLGHTIKLPKVNLDEGLKTVNFDLSSYNLAPGIYQLIVTNNLNEKKTTRVIIQ